MTHRFYIEGAIPKEGVFILNSEAVAHQLSRVLKIHEGEEVIFFNGAGIDHVTAIVKISRRFVSGRVKARLQTERDPLCEVHLFHALRLFLPLFFCPSSLLSIGHLLLMFRIRPQHLLNL